MGLSNFSLSLPIVKVDEEQRIVYGIATKEELDKQGEIVDYNASKKAFQAWQGNIREMHDPKRAVGKKIDLAFDDKEKQVMVGARISRSADGENAWQKIKEGILAGFSIGGRVKQVDSTTTKDADGNDSETLIIKDYDLTELSLVDNPAAPSAKIVMYKSMDGAAQEVPYVEERYNDPRPQEWWMTKYQFSTSQVIEKSSAKDNKNVITASDGKGDNMSDSKKVEDVVEKVDYNVRPQDGVAATAQAVEPGRGIEQDAAAMLNDSTPVSLPGGQAEGRESDPRGEHDQNEMYNAHDQSGAAAQAEGTEPGRGVATDQAIEQTLDMKELAQAVANLVLEQLRLDARGARLSSAAEVKDLMKSEEGEPVKEDLPVKEEVATETVDVTKAVTAELGKVTQLVKDLAGRIDSLEMQPAASKPKKYVDVDKSVDGDQEDGSPEAEYAALEKKASEMSKGLQVSPSERADLAFQLRKVARKLQK